MTVLQQFAWGHTPHDVIRAAVAANPAYAAGYKLCLMRDDTITLQKATRAIVCTDGRYTHRGKWTLTVDADTLIEILDDLLKVAFDEVRRTGEFGKAALVYTGILATLDIEEMQ